MGASSPSAKFLVAKSAYTILKVFRDFMNLAVIVK